MGYEPTSYDSWIASKNQGTLYFLLTPFRLLAQFLMVIGVVGLAIMCLFVNQFGWLVDLGSRSERARDEIVRDIGNEMSAGHTHVIETEVDFGKRSPVGLPTEHGEPGSIPYHSPDHFWVANPGDYLAIKSYESPEDAPDYSNDYRLKGVAPFVTTEQRGDVTFRAFTYCHIGTPGLFDTKLHSWSERGDPKTMLNRKSARLNRAFETAAVMTGALRSALAHMKAGQTLASEYGPSNNDLPLENSYCNADGANPKLLRPASLAAYRRASLGITIPDAPQVRFRYIYVSSGGSDDDPDLARMRQWDTGGMRLIGMCRTASLCKEEDLMPWTSWAGDIWASNPPLSVEQENAEFVMLRTATWDYWQAAAKANGLKPTPELENELKSAQHDLDVIFGEAKPDVETTALLQ
jgi:hypothetical protein